MSATRCVARVLTTHSGAAFDDELAHAENGPARPMTALGLPRIH